MRDPYPNHNIETNLIKIENLYKSIFTEVGNHKLTVIDTDGNELIIEFEIIDINQ